MLPELSLATGPLRLKPRMPIGAFVNKRLDQVSEMAMVLKRGLELLAINGIYGRQAG